MKKIGILSLLFTLIATSNAQITLNSKILDADTQEPIPYVNIGVFKKKFGTVTDENGRFALQIPESMRNESLSFSSIGYELLSLSIKKLTQHPPAEIFMIPKTSSLKEVTVISKKLKEKIKGEKILINLFRAGISGNSAGFEIGNIIRIQRLVRLKSLELQVNHISNPDLLFRLNLYHLKDDKPHEKLTIPNVIFRIEKPGNFSLDLTDYDILVANDFYAAVEIVKISANSDGEKVQSAFWGIGSFGEDYANTLILRAKKSNENIYFRIGSLNNWGQLDHATLGLYFKTLQ